MTGASCPSVHSGAVLGSSWPLGRRPRRGVRGRFKAAAGRGRRRQPGWLAGAEPSVGSAGPGGRGRGAPSSRCEPGGGGRVAEGRSPAEAGARGEPPGSPAGRRPAGALFRGWRCGWRCGRVRALPAAVQLGTRLRLCVASVSTTVCSGEVSRYQDLSGEGLSAAQTPLTVVTPPFLRCPGKHSVGRWAAG